MNTKNNQPNAAKCAAVFGCTIEQAKALLAKNAAVLSSMAQKAQRSSKRVNGYSATTLKRSAHEYSQAANSN